MAQAGCQAHAERDVQCAAQVLALIGLRSAKELVLRNKAIIEANVAHLEAFCKRHCTVIAFTAPEAGSVAFARLLTGEDVEAFCKRLVAEAGETKASTQRKPSHMCRLE